MNMFKLMNMFKGAITSFGVMCKAIAHSIQNCLRYLPAKSQGRATAEQELLANFKDYFWYTCCL